MSWAPINIGWLLKALQCSPWLADSCWERKKQSLKSKTRRKILHSLEEKTKMRLLKIVKKWFLDSFCLHFRSGWLLKHLLWWQQQQKHLSISSQTSKQRKYTQIEGSKSETPLLFPVSSRMGSRLGNIQGHSDTEAAGWGWGQGSVNIRPVLSHLRPGSFFNTSLGVL